MGSYSRQEQLLKRLRPSRKLLDRVVPRLTLVLIGPINKSIFTFSLRRFHNKQVYGCDQTAKGFFSYCEAYFSFKSSDKHSKSRKIQKLIANGDSTIIICKIRDLTPYAP